LVYSGVLTIGAAQSWFDWGWDRGVLIAYMATVAAISVLAMADLATRRWARSAVAGLVIDVGRSGDIGLQDAIRRAVGDPSMQIGFWVPDLDRYVDTAGRPLNVAATRSRITTEVDRDGEKIALLSHDVVTFADPELLQGVAAAARLAYDNAQLQAAAQAHISELSASRRRLVEAAERQRTLLEHDLRKSTFRGLEAAHGLLVAAEHDADGPMKPVVAGVDREVCRARDELDELAHGLRPRALTELGLAGALAELVERMPLLVELDLDIDSLAPALESAIYFVCAEALTNTVKHAGASRATVSVEIIGDWVVARVSDDGLGGARLDGAGSGLRGLAERAETLGGTLVLSGAPSGGTVVEVSIPLGQGRSSGDREAHPGPSHLEHMPTDEGR
jgi:signal transduction histidine kinase